MIISSDFMGIKFKFYHFYVSKLQNLKFLLQALKAFLNFTIKIFHFIHMLPFVDRYKILTILYVLLVFLH